MRRRNAADVTVISIINQIIWKAPVASKRRKAKAHPRMFNNWLAFAPSQSTRPRGSFNRSGEPRKNFITENGCASDDIVGDHGIVYETDRIMFLRSFLTQLQRETHDGVPVKGYFQWI
jgi:beta-glucosidase